MYKIKVYKEYISFCNKDDIELYKLYKDGIAYNLIDADQDIPEFIFELRDFFDQN